MTKNYVCQAPQGSPKWQKILSIALQISESIHHMIVIFGTRVKWWHIQILSSFFWSFDFSLWLGGKRSKNGSKRQKILYASLCISGTILYMIMVFNTLVQNQDISSNCFSYFQNSDFFGFRWKGYHNHQF